MTTDTKKLLPIGISSFEKIINQGYLYVDKTKFVANLSANGVYYFLSRPRRFGKTLFLDTLKQAFLGKKHLFNGLYLENNWNWNIQYPVIHFSFGGSSAFNSQDALFAIIRNILTQAAQQYSVSIDVSNIGVGFSQLIKAIHTKCQQQVVVLIDEYDKPILDVITSIDESIENREILKSLYSVIKDCDAYLRFVLLTGVSKFSKVSLFSGLNNLEDITLTPEFADICGYTATELDINFTQYLDGVDRLKLQQWYNGYNFTGCTTQNVYNPFDILLFLKNKTYKNYWFETGSPSFLLKLLISQCYSIPNLENLTVGEEILNSFDIENISVETLLFQTGYLTISRMITNPFDGINRYVLNYPNHEVRNSLATSLINYFVQDKMQLSSVHNNLTTALINRDFAQIEEHIRRFFASIPYNWYTNNNLAHYEGYYCSIIYSLFNSLGITAIPEEATSHGRIDLSLDVLEYYIILEFKLNKNGNAQSAIQQIKERGYTDKYKMQNKPIYLIGISFDTNTRNIHDFASELASGLASSLA